jgi:hypothetical protein
VDGVIQLDVPALRELLEVTGPVTVAGREFTPRNVERLIMHDLYAAFGNEAVERRHEFSALASATFAALNERAWQPAALVRALRSAARGRHLLAWSARPAEEDAWRRLGVDGSLERDALMLTVQNHAGNKLDWFLRPAMNLRIEQPPGRWRRAHLTIRIANPTPPGEPPSIAGDGRIVPTGDYRALVAVYLPGWATNVEIPGHEVIVAGPDSSSRVIGTRVDIARASSVTFEVSFSIPPDVRAIALAPSGRAWPIPLRFGGRAINDAVRRSLLV